MIVNKTNTEELKKALELTNKKFDDNITWNNYEALSTKRFRITLKCKDSKKAGHRLGIPHQDYNCKNRKPKQKRLISACWHAHGIFFDALLKINPETVIRVNTHKIDRYGGNWEDKNIGSMMHPLMFSEACECKQR